MKKILISISLLIVALLANKFVIKPKINEYKFSKAMQEAEKIPDTYWDEKYSDMQIKDKYKVIYVVNNGGEYTYGKYFQYAASKLGWEVKIYRDKITREDLKFDPDFILFSREVDGNLDMEVLAHRSRKYLVLFSSLNTFKYYGKDVISNKPPFFPLKDFSTLLSLSHAVLTSAKELAMYQTMFEKQKKTFNGFRMLSLAPKIDKEPAMPNKIMWVGTGWDDYRNSKDFIKFITLLAQNTEMKIYGKHNNLSFLPKGIYDGFIAPGIENIEAIHKNGIYLLTNSKWHFKTGEPGLRIFEATAAGAVIISDKHPFAIENFGDSFLYFDQEAAPEEMYKQVKAHYDWIKKNPEEAKEKAARAHQIFLEKFTLENDLIRIAKMHEYILKQEKEMALNYPLAY
ncbi:MAG: glycosyltransferase [Pseudomonadota bacterium]